MQKLIFRGPVMTASGYGVHARMLLKALVNSNLFDITVMSVPWGATPLLYDVADPFYEKVKELSFKFNPETFKISDYDVSVQVTIPNEFTKLAAVNIGVTAGIEVDRVSPEWLQKTNEFIDLLIVPSQHSAQAFRVSYQGPAGTLSLEKPMVIVPEWPDTTVFNTAPLDPADSYKFASKFNFLVVGLGMDKAEGEDRKNITNTVKWFCEQFRNNPDVGLVLKVSMVNYSPVDFYNIQNRIAYIKQMTNCGEFPRIHLFHGRMTDQELVRLYKSCDALVTLTHGEGYGLPILEAAACGLPVIATDWSGHLDFLHMNGTKKFVAVQKELKPIPKSAVWNGVMEEGTNWAEPLETDAKTKMTKFVLNPEPPRRWATELAAHIAVQLDPKRWENTFARNVWTLSPEGVRYSRPGRPLDHKLENVTLVAVSSVRPQGTLAALTRSMDQIKFGKVKFLTDLDVQVPEGIEIVKIDKLSSLEDYNKFIFKKLADHIDTDYCLIVQWDGYVLNGSAFSRDFLAYDYVGAPWYWDHQVGNGGFSIRSRRLLQELQKSEYDQTNPEDDKICRFYRAQLESRGVRFAPPSVASRFSVENELYRGQFGWHGRTPFYGELVEG